MADKEKEALKENGQPEVVPKSQYDLLLAQAQETIAEANHRISSLENDKKVLQDTLNIQNKLVEKLLNSDKK